MKSYHVYIICYIILTFIITIRYVKRKDSKSGCIQYGYIGICIFSINAFFLISCYHFSNTLKDVYDVIASDEHYIGTIVNVESTPILNSDGDAYEEISGPMIKFKRNHIQVIEKESRILFSNAEIGDTYEICYIEETDKIIIKGFSFIIRIISSFLFCFILSFIFIGEIIYIFNKDMKGYYAFLKKTGLYFFLPFIMIGFLSLLVYALFYGNNLNTIVYIFIIFFSIVLILGTLAYFKFLFNGGAMDD